MSLLDNIQYACVATGTPLTRLAQVPSTPPILDETLQTLLSKIHEGDHKRTLTTSSNLLVHYKVSNGVCYLCMADPGYRARICFGLLDDLELDYTKGEFNSERNGKKALKRKLKEYNNPSNDKIVLLQERVDQVLDVMMDNIDKVLERGDKLEVLQQTSEDLALTAQQFKKGTFKLKWYQRWKLFIIIFLIIVILLIVAAIVAVAIVAIACSGFTCGKSNNNNNSNTST